MSRDDPTYSRVSSRFWPEAKEGGWTEDMVTLGLFLLTCEQRTTEGLYRLPKGYMIEDLPDGWTVERLTASLDALSAEGFAHYDDKARVVFLPKAMKYQRPDNKNQQTAAIRNLKGLPATRFSEPFAEAAKQYAQAFHQAFTQAFPQGLGKGYRDSLAPALAPALAPTPATTPNGADPVDNSAEPERGCSIEPAEPSPEPPSDQIVGNGDGAAASHTPVRDDWNTCDGNPCLARDFPTSAYAPLRRAMLVSLHPAQQKEVGTHGDLDALLEVYAAHVCAACQAAFGEFERPQRDGMCEQAVVAAVINLHGSQDVAAVMKSRLLRFGLAELIGDRKLEELRRTKRDKRRKGEPVRVGEVVSAPQAVTP